MVTATSRILRKGGAILLLPFIALSYNPNKGGGIGFGYGITDNIYQLSIRDGGQIISISPYLFYSGPLDIDYAGDISLINFETDNLVLTNEMEMAKKILLPGIGNKTAFYVDVFSFYTPGYEQYRTIDVTGGNSLQAYLRNYFISLNTKLRYKYYLLDSLNGYLEPLINFACGIPLPYFVFTPDIEIGFRKYLEEFIPFYRTGSNLFFPLTMHLSAAMEINYLHSSTPQNDYITPLRYADDPFFEEENLEELLNLKLMATRTIAKKRIFAEVQVSLFRKAFHEVEDLERIDKGLDFALRFTKFIGGNLRLRLDGKSHINSSNIEDFDYMKNTIEMNLELIF